MSVLAHDARTVAVLWQRDLRLFVRQRARILGALVPPLLLWLALGAGIGPSFVSPTAGLDYLEYLFPGMLFMLLLSVAISATMSVIEDRRERFLQGVLVAPAGRYALALGKSLGSATVALGHALLFLAFAPFAGVDLARVDWPATLVALSLAALVLTGLGFVLAWTLNSVAGYHAVMSVVLFPLWMISGAIFPVAGLHPVLQGLVRANPMSYALAALRRGLYGGELPAGLDVAGAGAWTEIGVLVLSAVLTLLLAGWVATRSPLAR